MVLQKGHASFRITSSPPVRRIASGTSHVHLQEWCSRCPSIWATLVMLMAKGFAIWRQWLLNSKDEHNNNAWRGRSSNTLSTFRWSLNFESKTHAQSGTVCEVLQCKGKEHEDTGEEGRLPRTDVLDVTQRPLESSQTFIISNKDNVFEEEVAQTQQVASSKSFQNEGSVEAILHNSVNKLLPCLLGVLFCMAASNLKLTVRLRGESMCPLNCRNTQLESQSSTFTQFDSEQIMSNAHRFIFKLDLRP